MFTHRHDPPYAGPGPQIGNAGSVAVQPPSFEPWTVHHEAEVGLIAAADARGASRADAAPKLDDPTANMATRRRRNGV
jgi:hypothetical protein